MVCNVTFLMNGAKPPRGGEVMLARTIEHLDRTRFAPRLIFAEDNAFVSGIRSSCVESRQINLDRKSAGLYLREAPWSTPFLAFGVLTRLVRNGTISAVSALLRSWDTHVLFCGDNASKIIGGIAARRCRIPTVGACHDTLHRDPFGMTLQALNLGALDRVIAVSQTVQDLFPRWSVRSGKVVLIYNAVDTDYFAPDAAVSDVRDQEEAAFVIGMIGVLDHNKGHRVLLRAVADLKAQGHASIRLWIVGTGPDEAELKRLAGELGIADRVRFLGYMPDVRGVLAGMQALAMPTVHFESFALAALEAMAMGLPVVASRVGGLAEIIEDGRTGFLVQPGDPVELAGAIQRLMESPDVRARMGQAGRQRVLERFSLDITQAELETLLLNLVGSESS
jgi:glycosyltransferase involved in cell wall biosynthesis